MLNLFNIMDGCEGLGPIVAIVKTVFNIIQIAIPILLILFGTLDLGKAVMSNDEKEIKGAISKLIKRALMALAVFFVVFFVRLIFGWLAKANSANKGNASDVQITSSSWWDCWREDSNNNAAEENED